MNTIFVYGTLKRGFPNHGLMLGARYIGDALTVERYPMVVQGKTFSPVIMPEPGTGHRIMGELWEVDAEKLAALDRLESTHLPTGYVREIIEVDQQGRTVSAWVYFKPRDRVTIIHSEPHADYQDRRYVPASLRR